MHDFILSVVSCNPSLLFLPNLSNLYMTRIFNHLCLVMKVPRVFSIETLMFSNWHKIGFDTLQVLQSFPSPDITQLLENLAELSPINRGNQTKTPLEHD